MNSAIIQRYVLLKCRNNINFDAYRKISSTWLLSSNKTVLKSKQPVKLNTAFISKNLLHAKTISCTKNTTESISKIQDSYSKLQLKRRPMKRKKVISDDEAITGVWYVKALATAEEYDLEALMHGLKEQNLYVPNTISMSTSYSPGDLYRALHKLDFCILCIAPIARKKIQCSYCTTYIVLDRFQRKYFVGNVKQNL